MLNETKSLIRARFNMGMLDMMDLFELKKFITELERQDRRKKIRALQDSKKKTNI